MPTTYEYQYANNAAGQLLVGISAVATNCTLQAGQGQANFPEAVHDGPPAGGGDTAFKVTLIKSTGEREICLCKRASGSDIIYFIDATSGAASVNGRAQEGSTALAFEAGDQVELRLTKGQVESFEEDIDALQLLVTDYADLLDQAHLPGGADEADHDSLYYRKTALWTQTELAAAGGGAPIDSEHLTGKDAIAHSDLTDDEATKHRLINDSAGNGDTTELWSANKIYDQLALKSSSSHTHNRGNVINTAFSENAFGLGSNTIGPEFTSSLTQLCSGISGGGNTSFDSDYSVQIPMWLTTEMTRYNVTCKLGNANGGSANIDLRLVIAAITSGAQMNANIGSVAETGSTWAATSIQSFWTIYESPVGTMTIPSDGWYMMILQGKVVDSTPSKYWSVRSWAVSVQPTSILS